MAEDNAPVHLEYLEDSLRRADLHYSDVQRAVVDAQFAFDKAKQTLDALAAEAEALDASRFALRHDIRSARSAIAEAHRDAQTARVRRLLGNFPHELLRCIFLEATRCIDAEVWPDNELWGTQYDWEHPKIPFMLAAVTRQWRDVALQTPDLWTFLAVNSLEGGDDSAQLAYVKLVLGRSKRRPLDIFLLWQDSEWQRSPRYADILAAVGRHTHRWRRLSIATPADTPESALDIFRLPTPLLEGLGLFRHEDGPVLSLTASSTYLPFSPALRRLENTLFFSVPQTPLSRLTHLRASIDASPSSAAWALLGMIQSIERLIIVFDDVQGEAAPGSAPGLLSMQNLRDFSLTGWCERFLPWTACLEMPNLDKLRFDSDIIDLFLPLFEKVAGTLRTLSINVIWSEEPFLTADHVLHIQKLQKLQHLILQKCTVVGPGFSTIFASREAAGLPLLETITLDEPTLDETEAAHVSCLMQKLHARVVSGADDALAFKLIIEDEGNVPDWLIRQYKFITAGDSEGDADGAADDATESKSEAAASNSEIEAEFTDGGSGESYTSDSDWRESESEDEDDMQETEHAA
ncbi:hypothetical protein AURDEDRAFT_184946 [Auricularia subglabra TFB-10046 SS5]|nr:hypothetical protein AURDEDRAFT_184946 [Auricularia subglabra TFB-10046 SS5]